MDLVFRNLAMEVTFPQGGGWEPVGNCTYGNTESSRQVD